MNKVILIGRIGAEPTSHKFENGDVKTSFSLATSESYRKNEEWVETTEWHNITKKGETKLKKGDLIAVDGKIKTRKYTDTNGAEKYITEISAYKVEFLSRSSN